MPRLGCTKTYPNWPDSATDPSLLPTVYVLTANGIRLAETVRETRASILGLVCVNEVESYRCVLHNRGVRTLSFFCSSFGSSHLQVCCVFSANRRCVRNGIPVFCAHKQYPGSLRTDILYLHSQSARCVFPHFSDLCIALAMCC